jgi:branched-chain amino acid transport system permease protein
MRNEKKFSLKALIALGIILTGLILYPQIATRNYFVSVGVTFLAYATLGTSWNIIGGYAGQVSWCHASFLAIGAYTSYLLAVYFHVSTWISLLIGIGISLISAFIIGSISFRLSGTFFSLLTISFGEIVRVLLLYKKDITHGANGMSITYKEDNWYALTFRSDKTYYYLMLTVLVASIFVVYKIERSRLGYYLRAIKADQDAAESLGIEIHKVKLKAFLISAVIASIVGTFYSSFLSYIDPSTVASMDVSTKIGTMSIVGGLGTLFGPLIGAAILIPLTEVANALLGSLGTGMLLYGLVMLLIMVYRPGGVISFFKRSIN